MHADTLGWAAAALMVATFSCRDARRLRPLAVATNVAFIGYGLMASLMPVLVLHLLLLPINLWRCVQAYGWEAKQLGAAVERGGRALCTVALASLPLLAGCGGGGEESANPPPASPSASSPAVPPTPPAPPAPATLGAAGGTVATGDGASVSVPAGALAQEVAIEVTAAPAGAPALPAGLLALGKVYAFTPHGTTFALPAQLTVPFDAALVPAGVTPVLYKAEASGAAAGQWAEVPGATVQGTAMSAQVSGFSYYVVAPPLEFRGIVREWRISKTGALWPDRGEFKSSYLSRAVSDEVSLGPLHLRTDESDHARGFIYGNANGTTYWLGASTPAKVRPADPTGGAVEYIQRQFFRKRDDTAKLSFKITRLWIRAQDFSPRPPVGLDVLSGLIVFEVQGIAAGRIFFHRKSALKVIGRHGGFTWDTYSATGQRLWDRGQFGNALGELNPTGAFVELLEPIKVEVPLAVFAPSNIELKTHVQIFVKDLRQRESGVQAFLRDPQALDGPGIEFEFTGLDHAGVPPQPATPAEVEPAPACSGAAEPAAGVLQFESAAFVAEEGELPGALVVITRSGGVRGLVSARVSTGLGSAVPGVHYTPVSEHVAFGDGDDSPRMVFVPIAQDLLAEADRSVPLLLSDVRGCAMAGAITQATLSIADDDRPLPPPATYRIGGTVSGLAGSGFVLEDRAQFIELPIAADGTFEFNYNYASGAAYDVRVKQPPTNPVQVCTVTRGSGVVGSASVSNIAVDCVTPAPQSGLDLGFGAGTGKVTAGPAGVARAVALQPDGRIVAAIGNSVARYLADGTLDTSFGSGGSVGGVLGNSNFNPEINDIAVQPDGRIVAVGSTRNSFSTLAYDFGATRLNADGSRDTSFNGGSVVAVDWIGAPDRATRVLLQADGKLVLAGTATTVVTPSSDDSAMALVRLNADGSLDASFGTGGRAVAEFAPLDFGLAAALQADGKIVVAGRVSDNRSDDARFGAARFNANGSLDAAFGTAGKVRINEFGEAVSMALQPDGRMVFAMATRAPGGSLAFGLVRLNANGSVDTGFGLSNGLALLDVSNGNDAPTALALQADGHIVVAGSSLNTATSFDFVVARFLPNGVPDTTFGTGGFFSLDFFRGRDGAYDVLVQPDGKVLVSGSAGSGLSTLPMLLRLHP